MRTRILSAVAAVLALLSASYLLAMDWGTFFPPTANTRLFLEIAGSDSKAFADLFAAGPQLVSFAVVGIVSYTLLRFFLWRRAAHGPGAGILLASAILGAVPAVFVVWGLILEWVPVLRFLVLPDLWVGRLNWPLSLWGRFVLPAALLLLGIGLWRSRIVKRGVSVLAVAASVLVALAAGWPQHITATSFGVGSALQDATFMPAVWAELAFLLGLSVSLALDAFPRSPSNKRIERTVKASD